MKFDGFDDLMSAMTFAEAGEHEAALEMLKGRKAVLLVISGSPFDGKAFRYAMGVSKRVDAALEILFVRGGEKESGRLSDLLKAGEKEGLKFSRAIMKKGCMKKAVLDYLEKRRDIQLAIIGSDHELDGGCEEKSFQNFWKKLRCPLVVVSRNAEPEAT